MTRAFLLLTFLLAGCATLPAPTPSVAGTRPSATGSASFEGANARAHLDFLADPARGGRFTASRGYNAAADYVAARFAEAGLEPFGDAGTYLQHYSQPLIDLSATPVVQLAAPADTRLVHRRDFTESVGGRAGGGDVTGTLVFVGAAMKTANYDDFAGLPMSGAIALVVSAAPGVDVLRNAAVAGARAAILIGGSGDLFKPSYFPRIDGDAMPAVVATESGVDQLLASTGRKATDLRRAAADRVKLVTEGGVAPGPLGFDTGLRARVAVPLTPMRDVDAVNVVGVLRGSDRERSKRVIVVGGHLDGVGTDPDGTVFPGANDNASGPSITLELARVLGRDPGALATSVIFVGFAGEEQGLLGSQAFVERLARTEWPAASVVGFLNLDVAGCCGTQLSASDEDPALAERVKSAAAAENVTFRAGFRGGSDQSTFQRRRVPAVMVAWSDPGPLHTTRDIPATIEPARHADAGRVVLRVLRDLANSP